MADPISWEASPIPHSESLEEYRFGTIAASPESRQDSDGSAGDSASSRESSVDEGGAWYSVPSSFTTSPRASLSSVKITSPTTTASHALQPAGTPQHPPSAILNRRMGLLRMPAQSTPVPPSLVSRRGSLPSNNEIMLSSVGAFRNAIKGGPGSALSPASSPLVRSNSDLTARPTVSNSDQTDVEMRSPVDSGSSSLGQLRTNLASSLSAASPVGRPPFQRRDSYTSGLGSPYHGALSNNNSQTSIRSTSPSSYFPPGGGGQVTSPAGYASFSAPTTHQPMTPDSPTITVNRPSPLKNLNSSRSDPIPRHPYASSGLGGWGQGSGSLMNNNNSHRSKVASSSFPFPAQNGTATPPTTPASGFGGPIAGGRTVLSLPSKAQKPASGGATSAGPLSAHLLDDHVLNDLFNARYELRSSLGSGGYGFVCIAFDRVEGKEVAVKFILKAKVPSHSWVEWGAHGCEGDGMPERGGKVPMECELLIRLNHWGVVGGLACFADHKFFYLVRPPAPF